MTIDLLMKILYEEKDAYASMLKLSADKKEIIIKGDVQALENIIKQEQDLLRSITGIDKRRIEMTRLVSDQLGIKAEEVHLSDIIPLLEDEKQQEMLKFQDEFKEILDRQRTINDLNKKLIETQLDYIDFSIDAIAQTKVSSNNYGGDGLQKNNASYDNVGILDTEI